MQTNKIRLKSKNILK